MSREDVPALVTGNKRPRESASPSTDGSKPTLGHGQADTLEFASSGDDERGASELGGPTTAAAGPSPPKGAGEGTRCRCKKSQCLKLYCECFASQMFCYQGGLPNEWCICSGCKNTPLYSRLLQERQAQVRAKDPTAFVISAKTCRCKRTSCLKKYCECYAAEIPCGFRCKCTDCKNTATPAPKSFLGTQPKFTA